MITQTSYGTKPNESDINRDADIVTPYDVTAGNVTTEGTVTGGDVVATGEIRGKFFGYIAPPAEADRTINYAYNKTLAALSVFNVKNTTYVKRYEHIFTADEIPYDSGAKLTFNAYDTTQYQATYFKFYVNDEQVDTERWTTDSPGFTVDLTEHLAVGNKIAIWSRTSSPTYNLDLAGTGLKIVDEVPITATKTQAELKTLLGAGAGVVGYIPVSCTPGGATVTYKVAGQDVTPADYLYYYPLMPTEITITYSEGTPPLIGLMEVSPT